MLVTLVAMKDYLGITNNDYDDFLTTQIGVVSEAIESYCGRKFESATYTETIYKEDMNHRSKFNEMLLFHYPVSGLNAVSADGVDILANCRLYASTGRVLNTESLFTYYESVEFNYDAGYTTIPLTIQDVVFNLVEERYNKKTNGISMNFGNNVQRMSIPGAISIDFDYTLSANERKSGFGMILGDYLNVLDHYRSERALIGKIKETIVE